MVLHWPQIVYLTLALVGLGVTVAKHGDLRTGHHNAWASMLSLALVFGVLYAGGFFAGAA